MDEPAKRGNLPLKSQVIFIMNFPNKSAMQILRKLASNKVDLHAPSRPITNGSQSPESMATVDEGKQRIPTTDHYTYRRLRGVRGGRAARWYSSNDAVKQSSAKFAIIFMEVK
ncbi:unnamed protein product [Ceratitis capitata]|uniref:(Mediterranean fruit fly) hypothetical protein n=1 Tax=Ceratitis capitata TaxID=7213 RepID=A0A811V203_CERCA|nr:unnamed protein product [Ceratitis capitata]